MKKLLLSLLLITLAACSTAKPNVSSDAKKFACNTLNVYNWGVYIGEGVISDFEKLHNVKVNYSLYDSNEALYTKLLSGAVYDVIVPSDYMIEKLVSEDKLTKIDESLVPNIKTFDSEFAKTIKADIKDYTVPYFFGDVGIVYDKTKIDPEVVKKEGWEVLRNPNYANQLYMYDSERDSFMVALKALGYSMNTKNLDEINKAYEWLIKQKEVMNPAYVTDEAIDGLVNGEKAMGVMYSGDAAYILSQNKNMAYHIPFQGSNEWFDGFAIPKNSGCVDLAHEFINYMSSYDIAIRNSEEVGYTSPNLDVIKKLKEEAFADNYAFYHMEKNNKNESFTLIEETREKLAELWVKVKTK